MDSHQHSRTSKFLRHSAQELPPKEVSIDYLMSMMGHRGFGFIIMLFAIPNSFPNPIPGFSAITGLPLVLLGWQLARNEEQIKLPQRVGQARFSSEKVSMLLNKSATIVALLEKFSRPRRQHWFTPLTDRLVGYTIVVLSGILFLPIVFVNSLPGLTISVLSLALIEKDGVALMVGYFLTICSAIWTVFVLYGFVVGFSIGFGWISQYLGF